jgi:hypothetical protein
VGPADSPRGRRDDPCGRWQATLKEEGECWSRFDPSVLKRVDRVIAKVGEGEFRRGVAEMTGCDTDTLCLDDVVCVYVLACEGRVQPPGAGRRAVDLYPTLPVPTADDPCIDMTRSIRAPSRLCRE